MNAPVRSALTTSQQIIVTWSPLTATADIGNSAIISYDLEWDQGTNTWISLSGYSSNSLATQFTIS